MPIQFPSKLNTNGSPLTKIIWKNIAPWDKRKIFETFSVPKNIIGDVFVKIYKEPKNDQQLRIEASNRLGKHLGHELISLDKEQSGNIVGFDIKVEEDYRRKNFRIGELLRLGSIMEMLENARPYIKIFSKNSAIYFHGKYKFEPVITHFADRDYALEAIIADKSPHFKDLNKQAAKLYNEAQITQNAPAIQRELCLKTDALVKTYIERALLEPKPDKQHPFKYGFYMILKSDTVKQYRDYFNKIFERQGIDYKIPEK